MRWPSPWGPRTVVDEVPQAPSAKARKTPTSPNEMRSMFGVASYTRAGAEATTLVPTLPDPVQVSMPHRRIRNVTNCTEHRVGRSLFHIDTSSPGSLSADGCSLYFSSLRSGTY